LFKNKIRYAKPAEGEAIAFLSQEVTKKKVTVKEVLGIKIMSIKMKNKINRKLEIS
jgi:hypothetical protein